jgi:hypothetical protein
VEDPESVIKDRRCYWRVKEKETKVQEKEDWRKEDKEVDINHALLSSHWRLQYVTRRGKAGSDTVYCPRTGTTSIRSTPTCLLFT